MIKTQPLLKKTACPMCRVEKNTLFLEGKDLLHSREGSFRLVTCQSCGHIYQNPRPSVDDIGQYYPDDYIPFQRAIEDEPRWWKRFDRWYGLHRRCIAVHRAAGQAGHILDVGCATGIFLDGMRRRGWQTQGVELIPSAADYARQRFHLNVFTGTLEQALFGDHSFDVITLWDVLEHLHEPREALEEIARILRPGGLLVLSLPNPDSLEARLIGSAWLGWDLPRHLNLFRPLLLQEHLSHLGFEVEQIRSFTAGYAVLVMSLEQKLRLAGHDPTQLVRVLRSWPMRLLSIPYYAGPANWYNLSSIMVVFARRHPKGQTYDNATSIS